LVNILRALNIESYPVLVNTEFRHRIESWQPSPGIFDHAIAQIRIGGKIYCADATANYQRGPLSARYSPDYGYGLVIRPGTTALSPIKSTTGLPKESVTEKFTVRGKNEAAGLEVVTLAEGLEADKLRRQFATVSREEIEKNFLEYYTSIWQGARRVRPLEFKDDEQGNRIEMREFYELNNFWVQSGEDRKYRCSFIPRQISSFLEEPFTRGRSAPLSLIFPRHEIVRMEISLPASWPSDNDKKIINGPFFFYRRNVDRYGRKWIFEYEYRSLTEAVFPKDFESYMNQIKEASKAVGETFIWR